MLHFFFFLFHLLWLSKCLLCLFFQGWFSFLAFTFFFSSLALLHMRWTNEMSVVPLRWEDLPAMFSTPLYKPNKINHWAEVKPFMTGPNKKLRHFWKLRQHILNSDPSWAAESVNLASSSVSLYQTSGIRQSCIFTDCIAQLKKMPSGAHLGMLACCFNILSSDN